MDLDLSPQKVNTLSLCYCIVLPFVRASQQQYLVVQQPGGVVVDAKVTAELRREDSSLSLRGSLTARGRTIR